MNAQHERSLAELGQAVAEAVSFFATVDENLPDGEQTARSVLSHLVFWHREYVAIAEALAAGRAPVLLQGRFTEFYRQAYREFASVPLPSLASQLAEFQARLDRALRAVPDWKAGFPIKQGGKFTSVEQRVPSLAAHIHNHVVSLRKAQRHALALAY